MFAFITRADVQQFCNHGCGYPVPQPRNRTSKGSVKSRPAIYFPAGSDSVLHSPLHREPSEFFQIAWNNPFRIGVDDAGIRGQPPGA